MSVARLPDRAVIGVAGPEARAFLDRIVSGDVEPVAPGRAAYGGLLTPQGKIIADFIVLTGDPAGERLLLDTPAATAAELKKRLTLYRLRAKLAIEDLSDAFDVVAGWGEAPLPADAVAAAPDPRLPALGWRAVVPSGTATGTDPAAYHAHRAALGVPEAVYDFALGDAFPHEALMDQLGGVDFRKGCYVGQEVVSRMQHRGTARTRVVALDYGEGEAAAPGSPVTAAEKTLGSTGTAAGRHGLALIRIDRAADAMAAGEPILAGGRPAQVAQKPDWVRFAYPGEAQAAPAASPAA